MKKTILEKLGLNDPYLNYKPEYTKFSGWNSISQNLRLAKDKMVCLEIGSWMGNSANFISSIIPENGVLICCDTFLGSHEHFLDKKIPRNEYGKPTLYEHFLSNTFKNQSKIIPIMLTSSALFEVLRKLSIRLDFIYIDGDHRENAVFQDITESYERLNEGGIIVGDDYSWDTVKSGLNKTNLKFEVNNEQYILRKNENEKSVS